MTDDPRRPIRRELQALAESSRRLAVDLDTIRRANYQTAAGYALATRAVLRMYFRAMQTRIDAITTAAGIDPTPR